MGSYVGVLKIAAKRLGMTYKDYKVKLDAGLKWCTGCQRWLPRDSFYKNAARGDGLSTHCPDCMARINGYGSEDRPGTTERREMAEDGLYWCRRCEDWLPEDKMAFHSDGMSDGVCLGHRREIAREYYASSEERQRQAKACAKRRRKMVKPVPAKEKRRLLSIFDGLCAYCLDAPFEEWDHVLALANGGKSEVGNVVPACQSCNQSKSAKDVYDWADEDGIKLSDTFLDVIDTDIVDVDYTPWVRSGSPGGSNPQAIFTDGEAEEIRKVYATGDYSYSDLAEEYGVHRVTISRIVRGVTYNG